MTDIQKIPLKDKIASVLIQRIIDGDIVSGEKLREAHLAKAFGVSQAPVREAIITLVAKGILEHTPNVGTQLKRYTKEETIEIYQTREALELYAASYIENFSKLDVLKQEYQKMLDAAKQKDARSFVEHDQFFHELLVHNAANCLMLKLWREQYVKSSVLNVLKEFELHLEDVVKIHEPIISGIEEKSVDRCSEAIHYHYSVIINNIKGTTKGVKR